MISTWQSLRSVASKAFDETHYGNPDTIFLKRYLSALLYTCGPMLEW
jgi:hypothetical protein